MSLQARSSSQKESNVKYESKINDLEKKLTEKIGKAEPDIMILPAVLTQSGKDEVIVQRGQRQAVYLAENLPATVQAFLERPGRVIEYVD
jgi:hypothetical protein